MPVQSLMVPGLHKRVPASQVIDTLHTGRQQVAYPNAVQLPTPEHQASGMPYCTCQRCLHATLVVAIKALTFRRILDSLELKLSSALAQTLRSSHLQRLERLALRQHPSRMPVRRQMVGGMQTGQRLQ